MDQIHGAGVLDLVLQLSLQVREQQKVLKNPPRQEPEPREERCRYQLVEGVLELLQTVDELLLLRSLGAQRQDALWWTEEE